jgi:hypothetical protein
VGAHEVRASLSANVYILKGGLGMFFSGITRLMFPVAVCEVVA